MPVCEAQRTSVDALAPICHNATEEEVEQVLRSPGEDRPGPEDSRVAIGQTSAGR
jgi:hypothetical protein